MKKYFIGFVVGLLIALPIQVFSDNMIGKVIEVEVPVKVNGEYLQVNAIGLKGTTYAPVRSLSESLNAEVYWDADSGEVIIETADLDDDSDNSKSETEGDEPVTENTETVTPKEKTEAIEKLAEINRRIQATRTANTFTQKVIDEDMSLLNYPDLSPEERSRIEERIQNAQKIIEKNNSILDELEAEKAELEEKIK